MAPGRSTAPLEQVGVKYPLKGTVIVIVDKEGELFVLQFFQSMPRAHPGFKMETIGTTWFSVLCNRIYRDI